MPDFDVVRTFPTDGDGQVLLAMVGASWRISLSLEDAARLGRLLVEAAETWEAGDDAR